MTKRAFTLIELLVVISVIGVLMGMLMPIVTMVNRLARTTATRSVMAKIDTAARLFRSEIGSYPWQESYADLASGAAWTNRLYYQLGTDIAPADWIKVKKDATDAAALYRYETSLTWPPPPAVSPHAFVSLDVDNENGVSGGTRGGKVAMANRMAAERARLAILAGNYAVTGCVMQNPWKLYPTVVRTPKPLGPLLAAPASSGKAGWAKDFIEGELEKRYIKGDAIVDGWGRPLLYICQVVEGMTAAPSLKLMGSEARSFIALDYGLQPLGRRTLASIDKITGDPLVADPTFLPDITQLKHSDRRYYAAPDYELEFELWSAGPDGRADWIRDAKVNADNISLIPYDKRLP